MFKRSTTVAAVAALLTASFVSLAPSTAEAQPLPADYKPVDDDDDEDRKDDSKGIKGPLPITGTPIDLALLMMIAALAIIVGIGLVRRWRARPVDSES